MARYLPVLLYALAALAVLCVAGLGASGSLRGMVRYLKMWGLNVLGLVLLALVVGALIGDIRNLL